MSADVVAEWGSEKIAKELLVGFSPVRRFVDLLERRFGHLGLFCVDFDGGEIIAIKWRPAVSLGFCPSTLRQVLLRRTMKSSGSDTPDRQTHRNILTPLKPGALFRRSSRGLWTQRKPTQPCR